MPTKGLGIILGDVTEELSQIIDHQSNNKVEMKYFGKTLERLWYYLNFYRESNKLVERLRKSAKSLMKQGNHKLKVTAFRITTEEDNINILNNFSTREAIFYTTDALEIFDLERLLFIESSRYLLEYGDLRLFKTASGLRFINKFLTLKTWIFSNFDKQEFNEFLVIGSTILFSFGIRVPNDIDLYINNSVKNKDDRYCIFDKSFIRRFQRKKKNAPDKFFQSIDIMLPGFGKCRKYHTICYLYTKWQETFGATNINEAINNQKFHYFFLGFKCLSFHGIIERQTRRCRPKQYADLLYMGTQKRLLNLLPDKTWDIHNKRWDIPISSVPQKVYHTNNSSKKQECRVFLGEAECEELYKQIQSRLKCTYNCDIELEEIKRIISNSDFIPQIMVNRDCKTMQILSKLGIEPSDIQDDIC